MFKHITKKRVIATLSIAAIGTLLIQVAFAQPTSAPPGGNIDATFDTVTTSDITLDDTAGSNTPAVIFNNGTGDSNKIEFSTIRQGEGKINFALGGNTSAMTLYSPLTAGRTHLSVNSSDTSYPLLVDGVLDTDFVGKFIAGSADMPTLALENSNNAGTPGLWMGESIGDHAEITYNTAANSLDFVLENSGSMSNKDVMRIYSPNPTNANVAINSTDLTHPLTVEGSLDDYVAKFYNNNSGAGLLGIAVMAGGSTGQTNLMEFMDYDGTPVGSITKNGVTVSYNAFTGGHNATIPTDHNESGYEYGTIMSTTNVSTAVGSHQPDYTAAPSTSPYDTNIMGVYAAKNVDSDTTHQIYALGDGHVLVTTENGSIKAGDPITSSNAAGLGMKATEAGTILGYALEDWDGSDSVRTETLADGTEVKVGLVAVYYYPGTKYTPDQETKIQSLEARISKLEETLNALTK